MAYRSGSIKTDTNFFAASSCVITTPSGATGTDTLFAFLACGSGNQPTTFTGWTDLGSTSASGAGPSCNGYIRTHDGSSGSYTFTWAGNETGIMGGILAFDNTYSTAHKDDASFYNYAGGSPKTLTIASHAQAVANQIIYATYCIPAGAFTGGSITPPAEAGNGVAANWIPADVGTERAGMAIHCEVLTDSSEPARDFVYTWSSGGGNNLHGVAQRQVAVDLDAAGGLDVWGWQG